MPISSPESFIYFFTLIYNIHLKKYLDLSLTSHLQYPSAHQEAVFYTLLFITWPRRFDYTKLSSPHNSDIT